MNVPFLVKEYSLEEMIEMQKEIFRQNNPGVLESESDYYMPVIESWAESMFRLRAEVNYNFRQHFWKNAVAEGLDVAASFFGVTRLLGSRPFARFLFTLSEVKTIDMNIPAETVLSDGESLARLNGDVLIPAGSLSAEGVVVLDAYVVSSTIKTESIVTAVPYLEKVTQLESFHDGAEIEKDEALRNRVSLALETLSGAGPVKAYMKRTFDADSRIKDVSVFEIKGRVQIVIDSEAWDALLVQRVTEANNAEDVRPLNDKIDVYQAEVVTYDISVVLTVTDGYSRTDVVARAKEEIMLLSNTKIGESVSLARIIEASFVDGVKDVQVLSPNATMTVSHTQVLRLGSVEVTYE